MLRVRAPSGRLRTFDAELVSIDGPFASATGYWRGDSGHLRRAYVWPASRLVEIRYVGERVAA